MKRALSTLPNWFVWFIFSMLLSCPSFAANQSIELISAYSKGGASDIAARFLARFAEPYLDQPIFVSNVTGRSGQTGSYKVHQSEPDGTSLLLARIGAISAPAAVGLDMLYPYDDFTMLGLLEINPMVCSVSSDSQFQHINDFINAVKKEPGTLSYSTAGFGTSQHLTALLLLHTAEVENVKEAVIRKDFKGGLAATIAVVEGNADLICNPFSAALGAISTGHLRPLLINTPTPHSQLPEVPTAADLGYGTLEKLVGWSALFGPPNMSNQLTKKWSTILININENSNWRSLVTTTGSLPTVLPPEQTRQFVEKQYQVLRQLTLELNLQPDR